MDRRSCAFGEPGLTYRYSGVNRVAMAWPDSLRKVADRMTLEHGSTVIMWGATRRYLKHRTSIDLFHRW